jgi:hypothetical protein
VEKIALPKLGRFRGALTPSLDISIFQPRGVNAVLRRLGAPGPCARSSILICDIDGDRFDACTGSALDFTRPRPLAFKMRLATLRMNG